MMNSHILTHEFELHQADSVEDGLVLLKRYNGQAKVLAGGTDLLVNMKIERASASHVIYLGRIEALKEIKAEESLKIGALATFYDLQESEIIRSKYRALNEAAHSVSGTQIKVMGSIGGNLCNASPAADLAPPLLVFDVRVELSSAGSSREVPLADFFVGPGRTIIGDSELLTTISVPPTGEIEGSAFLKLGRVGADIAKVSTAARIVREHDRIIDSMIALGSVAPTPIRARRAEGHLVGRKFSMRLIDEASQLAAREIKPITDLRSTEQYRVWAAQVLVRDALLRAWDRSKGGDT